jgi:antitoxin component YwqK of YwqJK toxin-antitoxin module
MEAQSLKRDTFFIKEDYKKTCLGNYKLSASGGKYFYNGKEIDKVTYLKMDKFAESICDSLLGKADGQYCKFYIKDSVIIEEGVWHHEYFEGPYKAYYENGKIKIIGTYSATGIKTGRWLYYDKKGKLKKKLNYK